ncbi:MAG: propionyl-CoA synthetase, partial [Pseudomonadales bacterium]|nr:propionyl-CoA synthetase [Pseudomonadales bacterium]
MASEALQRYQQAYNLSLSDPESFWGNVAGELTWERPWDKVLDTGSTPHGRWFVGGEINTCYNALDRHVEAGRGEQTALIYDSPVTGNRTVTFSYRELRDLVARFAGALVEKGVGKG